MNDEQQKTQKERAWREGKRGEAPRDPRSGTESPKAGARDESLEGSTEKVMEEICQRDNLKRALKRVEENRGAPGVDGMKVEELRGYLRQEWPKLREQLLSGQYNPQPVRRVEIPKEGGGARKLGIPTALDRFIQQAVQQVLQQQWDRTFSESSYGFRPGRSAHQAVAKAQEHIASGFPWVVDLDLEKFFDRVHPDRLMARIAQRVKDKRLLKLIRAFLNAGAMEGGLVSRAEEGVPQGGPLSPLLSNLVLDELDKELERRGHHFVRYADDCNIYVKTEKAGRRVMASVSRYIEEKLRLKVNAAKSAVARPRERQFLGFSFTGGKTPKRRIGQNALERFKKRVRGLTRRVRGASLAQVVTELSAYLRGWKAYFGFCQTPSVLKEMDSWIRHRLRTLKWAQWRNNWRRAKVLLQMGADRQVVFHTARCGYKPWRAGNSRVMNTTLDLAYFRTIGLVSLHGT